ncbi:PepSY-associated TM helix domain-containing protein [Micromonospora sp. M12]
MGHRPRRHRPVVASAALRRGAAAAVVRPRPRGRSGRTAYPGWHAATGLWLAVGLLFLSATGLTWSRHAGESFGAGLDALNSRTPRCPPPCRARPHPPTAAAITRATAGRPPCSTRPRPTVSSRSPAARVGRSGRDHARRRRPVGVDGHPGGQHLAGPQGPGCRRPGRGHGDRAQRLRVLAAAGTAERSRYPGPHGVLFGPINQILLAALALGLLCVIVWGYRMWWQRRPTRTDRRAPVGTVPERGRGGWRPLGPRRRRTRRPRRRLGAAGVRGDPAGVPRRRPRRRGWRARRAGATAG